MSIDIIDATEASDRHEINAIKQGGGKRQEYTRTMEHLLNQWPFFVAACTVIGALVLFGKNLADLILKWRDVLNIPASKGKRIDLETGIDDKNWT